MEKCLHTKRIVELFMVVVAINAMHLKAQDSYFIQSDDGLIVIEAEHCDSLRATKVIGGFKWKNEGTFPGASGNSYMVSPENGKFPNVDGARDTSASMTYPIEFKKTGIHYFWARASFPDDQSDSFHYGIGDSISDGGYYINFWASGLQTNDEWGWAFYANNLKGPAVFEIPEPGIHHLGIYVREPNLRLDKIIVTTDASYVPEGMGPDESEFYTGISNGSIALSASVNIFPNPIAGQATIAFDILNRGNVVVGVYNGQGQLIEVLLNKMLPIGENRISWDINNSNLSSGIYFLKIDQAEISTFKKIVVN